MDRPPGDYANLEPVTKEETLSVKEEPKRPKGATHYSNNPYGIPFYYKEVDDPTGSKWFAWIHRDKGWSSLTEMPADIKLGLIPFANEDKKVSKPKQVQQVVKTVGDNGQISLGKKHAGRHVLIEKLEPGVWKVQLATVTPAKD